MQVLHISRQNSENLDVSLAFQPLTVAKLSTLKTSAIFWPTLYVVEVVV